MNILVDDIPKDTWDIIRTNWANVLEKQLSAGTVITQTYPSPELETLYCSSLVSAKELKDLDANTFAVAILYPMLSSLAKELNSLKKVVVGQTKFTGPHLCVFTYPNTVPLRLCLDPEENPFLKGVRFTFELGVAQG